jgi:hypothetical protein
MKLQQPATLLLIGLSISAPLDVASAGEGFERAFHAYHLAEIGCKLWYSDAARSRQEDTLGRKACHMIEHPFASLLEHKPRWWSDNEPKFLNDLESWIVQSPEPPEHLAVTLGSKNMLGRQFNQPAIGAPWNYLSDDNSLLSVGSGIARSLPPAWESFATPPSASARVKPFLGYIPHETGPQFTFPSTAFPTSGSSTPNPER